MKNFKIPLITFLILLSGTIYWVLPEKLPVYGDILPDIYIKKSSELDKIIADYNVSHLLFVTKDKVAVEVNANDFRELTLSQNHKKWFIVSQELPRPINLKDIDYVAVKSDFEKYNIAFFSDVKKQTQISHYDTIKAYFTFVGAVEKNNRQVSKFEHKCDLKECGINTHLDFEKFGNDRSGGEGYLIVFSDGKENYYQKGEFKEKVKFKYTYWMVDSDILRIIWEDSPELSINEVVHGVNEVSEQPILLICVDGFGYNIFQNAKARKVNSFLTDSDFTPIRTKYPPRTNVVIPFVLNSIHKKGVIITDDKVFYTSDLEIIMNKSDEDIYITALRHLNKDHDFMFVHFHSIDDMAHEHGPYSQAVLDQIALVGNFVQDVVEKSKRKVIIFSDHGLHVSGLSGTHGVNRIEDMVGVWGEFVIRNSEFGVRN